MTDILTVITSRGRRMTKLWDGATGKIEGYEKARQIKVEEHSVDDIYGLSKLLTDLEPKQDSCIIRGRYVGDERAKRAMPILLERDRKKNPDARAPERGFTLRRLELFDDRKLHYLMIDIDNYKPKADPVESPVECVEQYIVENLPEPFHNATYHWQLSSSAGHESNRGVLKAHIWFWLSTPYTGDELTTWAQVNGINIDVTVLRTVQPNYTAYPIFTNGAEDPAKLRSGLVSSIFSDTVDLQFDTTAVRKTLIQRKSREDMVDPSEKEGLIGLFHRTYTIETVVENWLSDVFEFVDENRLNYLLSSSGAKEGAGVTSNRQGLFNTHNGDPFKGRAANKWDLVRHYKFGHLDDGVDELIACDVTLLPSQQAMMEFAAKLPEIADAARETAVAVTNDLRDKIEQTSDAYELEALIQSEISPKRDLSAVERGKIESLLKVKFSSLGVNLPVKTIRDLMKPKRVKKSSHMEAWCENYVWCQFEDAFVHVDTQEKVTVQSFNAKHGRDVKGKWVYGDSDMPMQAAYVALQELQIPVVSRRMYLPWADQFFERDGLEYLNMYRPSTVPSEMLPEDWTGEQKEAVDLVVEHLTKLCTDDTEHIIRWMAYCVQNPGRKIRWSLLIKGTYGDGKSLLGTIMEMVMGQPNVGKASPKVVNSEFNGYAEGHCVCVLEELRMQGHSRYDTANSLKELHTNDIVTIHRKRQDSYSVFNTQNYMAFTNFMDAVPIDDSDRRWMVIFSPFNDVDALTAAGMNDSYFDRLFEAIRNNYDALRGWLLSVNLDDFNPNGRAPDTTAKKVMISANRPESDEAVMDVIQTGSTGVSTEVISTTHLSLALAEQHPHIELRGRAFVPVLSRLGFIRRPDPIKWRGQSIRVWLRTMEKLENLKFIHAALEDTVTEVI